MPFIPNEADTVLSQQAEPDSQDFEMLLLGYQRTGVESGCAVTATGSQAVNVASGVVVLDGTPITVSTQSGVSVTNAETNPRFDLISINSSGTAVVTAGTAAAQPSLPAVPANSVPLASLYVIENDNVHWTYKLVDKRIILANNLGDLSDVDVSSKTDGYVVTYESSSDTFGLSAGTPGPAGSGGANIWYTIAASDATTFEKAGAEETLDGTDDHVQINAALRNGHYVQLSKGTFDIGAPILMDSGNVLQGSGWLTHLKANGITTGDQAVIAAYQNTARGAIVRDLQINGNYTGGGNGSSTSCHGVYFKIDTNMGNGETPAPNIHPDNTNLFFNLLIRNCRAGTNKNYSGLYLSSTDSLNRSSVISHCYMFQNGHSNIRLSGSSDNQIADCHLGWCAGNGVEVGGASNRLVSTKQFYAQGHGFNVTSSRVQMIGCNAQDNKEDGLHITGVDADVSGFNAEGNGLGGVGAGVYLGANGGKIDFAAYDHNDGTSQDYGIEFGFAVTGWNISGTISSVHTTPIQGSPGSGNLIAIQVQGGTNLVQGY